MKWIEEQRTLSKRKGSVSEENLQGQFLAKARKNNRKARAARKRGTLAPRDKQKDNMAKENKAEAHHERQTGAP